MKEPAALRRLPGVRGFLFDVDRVLHLSGHSVPAALSCLLTNTTTASRGTLAARLRGMGHTLSASQVITALVATAAYIRHRFLVTLCG